MEGARCGPPGLRGAGGRGGGPRRGRRGGGRAHRTPRGSAGLRVPRGRSGPSPPPPPGSPLLPGGGQDPRPPCLALLRRRGGRFHSPKKGPPRWPVPGLGLGRRPPGARRLPSLQGGGRKERGEWRERERGAGAPRARAAIQEVAAGSPGGRVPVPAEPRLWRTDPTARGAGRAEAWSSGRRAPSARNGEAGEPKAPARPLGERGADPSTHRPSPRIPPGTNCRSGPQGKLRLLTDGVRPRRLQLPEARARCPQNAWHQRPLPHPGVFGRGRGERRTHAPTRSEAPETTIPGVLWGFGRARGGETAQSWEGTGGRWEGAA